MVADDQFIVVSKNGYYCPAGDFYIDPRKAVKQAVISHAHADHAIPGNGTVYCTAPTMTFMEHRYKNKAAAVFQRCNFGEPFIVNGVKITFFPAGHILGSAQVLFEHNGIRYLYTGDIKLQEDATCEAFQAVMADVLITETTFANPTVQHPNPVAEIKGLLPYTANNIIIGVYALGKAQRITDLVHKHCPEFRVLVHPVIAAYHKIYESFGINLGAWEIYDRHEVKQQQGIIYLVPPAIFGRYGRNANFVRAFATGWNQVQHRMDVPLRISDHVDWNDLLEIIPQVNPSTIFTIHGDGTHIQQYFQGTIGVLKLA